MDFLDPKKQKAHDRRLALGYVLIALLLLLSTTVLLYQAYGFGIDRSGHVIQNGLVFLSSQPQGADIYVNKEKKTQTNDRLVLPAGAYTVELKKDGYRDWKRPITIDGGSVGRFDYPFLVPTTLATTTTKQYTATPSFLTQSRDRHWLVTQGSSLDRFDVFNINVNASKTTVPVQSLDVPSDIYTASTTTKGWTVVEWSDDNRHVTLKRDFDKDSQSGSEYILFDRQDPTQSQNLTELFGVNPTNLAMRDKKFDQYYLYDQNAQQLLTATVKKPTPQPLVSDVVAYTNNGDMLLYATTNGAQNGKLAVKLRQDTKTYDVRQITAHSTPLLELASYGNTWFAAVGAQSENKVYVYKDPVGQLLKDSSHVPVPAQILKVDAPSFVSFSKNGRFAMAQNATQVAVYDEETDKGYVWQFKLPIDTPQTHISWMDGFRMTYVTAGKVAIMDFDGTNSQVLSAANPAYLPMFNPNYNYLFTLTTQNAISNTPLMTPADL